MNKRQINNELEKCFSDIDYHNKVPDELLRIILKTGKEADFFKLLVKRIKLLKKYKSKAVTISNGFKKLKVASNFWRIAICIENINLRIIYTFTNNGRILLLYAFFEKGNKNKTDYQNAIKVAQKRLKEI